MSVHYKMIIPLLDNVLTKEDFSEGSHFIGIYNDYPEKPFLKGSIFLLYEYVADKESGMRNMRFLSSPYLYDSEVITIKKKPYFLYTFSVCNHSIKRIMGNLSPVDKKDLFKIFKFWNFEDDDVNNYLLHRRVDSSFDDEAVPEIDWKPDETDLFKQKEQVLL